MAFHAFMQLLYSLQHYPTSCTAYHQVSGSMASGYGGDPSNPPVFGAFYHGNCLQAFLIQIQGIGGYFSFG